MLYRAGTIGQQKKYLTKHGHLISSTARETVKKIHESGAITELAGSTGSCGGSKRYWKRNW